MDKPFLFVCNNGMKKLSYIINVITKKNLTLNPLKIRTNLGLISEIEQVV